MNDVDARIHSIYSVLNIKLFSVHVVNKIIFLFSQIAKCYDDS